LAVMFFCAGASAEIGRTDRRVDVSASWSQHPYNLIGRLLMPGVCTGQYVGPDLILTAAHCVDQSGFNSFQTYRGSTTVRLLAHGGGWGAITDWALYRIDDANFHIHGGWFSVATNSRMDVPLQSAGFGALRVLTDSEIDIILDAMIYILERDENNIHITRVRLDHTNKQFIQDLETELARRGINPIFDDSDRLKSVRNCATVNAASGDFLANDCETWPGNSGGAVWTGAMGAPTVVGVVFAAAQRIGMESRINARAVRSENFRRAVQEHLGARP